MSYLIELQKDPEITWEKVLCPRCGEPTGPSSKCETLKSRDKEKVLHHPTMGILPVFGPNCVFKNENMWKVHTNFPVSLALIDEITQKVDGIQTIIPLKSYTFQIVVAHLFSERDVQRNVNIVYRAFIKSLQVKFASPDSLSESRYYLVNFPNGAQVDNVPEAVQRELVSAFPSIVCVLKEFL